MGTPTRGREKNPVADDSGLVRCVSQSDQPVARYGAGVTAADRQRVVALLFRSADRATAWRLCNCDRHRDFAYLVGPAGPGR